MHLLITGSRGFMQELVWEVLDGFHAKYPITDLTHGGARGVDKSAHAWAEKNLLTDPLNSVTTLLPLWVRHGKRAGLIRNEEMLATCPALDCAYLAIWDGNSTGTAHMRGLMQNAVRTAYPEAGFNAEPMAWNHYKGIKLAFHIPQHIYQAQKAKQLCPMCGEAPAKNDSICEDCTEYVNAPHM